MEEDEGPRDDEISELIADLGHGEVPVRKCMNL
jgi:hypothetical protein